MAKSTKQKEVQLRLHSVIRKEVNVRSFEDARVRVTRTTVEYCDPTDHSVRYRKAFEAKGTAPDFPVMGTHTELNDLKKQW